jgi:hypothetical protein
LARICTECGNKFDLIWLGDPNVCRACFTKRRDDSFVEVANAKALEAPVAVVRPRSFAAANGLFDFLTVIAWLIIGIGVIGFVILLAQVRGIEQTIVAVVVGMSALGSGLFFLALVQIGRATVYSAETNGEMLALARRAAKGAESHGEER